jgi:hypothetical protein
MVALEHVVERIIGPGSSPSLAMKLG